MIKYDPKVLHRLAGQLYDRAEAVLFGHVMVGGLLGAGGFLLNTAAGLCGVLIGLLIGYWIGDRKAFQMRVEAQLILCQVQIEENTRSSAPTAVETPATPAGSDADLAISAESVRDEQEARDLLARAEEGKLNLSDKRLWEFATRRKLDVLLPHILSAFDAAPHPVQARVIPDIERYLEALPPGASYRLLGTGLASTAMAGIRKRRALEPRAILSLIESSDAVVRRQAVALATAEKAAYEPGDADELRALALAIEGRFLRAPDVELPAMFGRVKTVWRCYRCGTETKAAHPRCPCGADRYGFWHREVSPPQAIEALMERVRSIESLRG